jgi:long-chain fatty acid transport protein
MLITIHRCILALIVFTITIIPSLSHATNGMFLIGNGAQSRAMGGAAIALSGDSIYTHSNPAALGNTEMDAMRIDLDGTVFHPDRRAACCLAPDGVVSRSKWFLIPAGGFAYKFNRKVSMGMSFVGSGGGNTRYEQNFFDAADDGSLGVNLLVAEMSPAISYKLNKQHTVGVSPVIAIQSFRAYGLGPFQRFSTDPDKVTNNGNEFAFGYGARLGWQSKFFDKRLTVGGAFTSKRYMTKMDKYEGLFADGRLDLPESLGLGIALKPFDKWTIAFDWTKTYYSNVAAIGNESLPIVAGDPGSPNALGSSTGPGFGWEDQNVYKLGLQYDWNEKWAFRAGANYGESPIPDDDGRGEHEFNVLAPAVTEWHFTIGSTYKRSKMMEFSFAYVYSPKRSQTAFVPTETGLPFENEDIELQMRQHSASATVSLLF